MSCQNVYESPYLDNATGSRGYWSDRDVNDQLILPHTFNEIKIKPNDLVSAHVINGAFSKLYDNLLYIISKTRTPQSVVPNRAGTSEFIGTLSPDVTGLFDTVSHDSEDLIVPANQTAFTSSEMSNQITGVFLSNDRVDDVYPNRGVVFTSTGDQTNLTMLQDSVTGYSCKSVSNKIDNFTNRSFTDDIVKTIVSEDILYTATSGTSVVYKHDVAGLRDADKSYFDPDRHAQGKLLVDVIGADGDIEDHARFRNILTMSSDDLQNLYVVDTDDSVVVVKMFDKNSNYITTYNITDHVSSEQINDMCFANNKFFILTDKQVHEFTLKFVSVKSTELTDTLLDDEQYRYITPSVDNSNVVYVSTNNRVFKKFITRLDGNIGVFKFTGRGPGWYIDSDTMDISFVSVVRGPTGDSIYVGDKSRGVVFRFNESIDYQQVCTSTYENTLTTLQSILIKSDEYVNYIVYNKAIAKMFYNHAAVGNSIRKKIVVEYNNRRYLEFKALRYLLPQNIKTRNRAPTLKNFIGINEVVMSAVINRTLKYIYKLQEDLMFDIQVSSADATQAPATLSVPTSYSPEKTWTYGDDGWSETEEQ